MARPRINQFADDIGVTRNRAKQLIEQGRSRRDGGSQTMGKHLNRMRGFESGGIFSRGAGKAIQGTKFRGVR